MPAAAIGYHCYGGAALPGRPFSPSRNLPIPVPGGSLRNSETHSRSNVEAIYRKSIRANSSAAPDCGIRRGDVYEDGKSYYLDEQDVVTFLDPPKELIPLDASSFNPASYLWKKIEDIPEERRHHLLSLLDARLTSRAWEIAGRRYDDDKLVKKRGSPLLSGGDQAGVLELWDIRTKGAPLPIAWIHSSQKAIFRCSDGKLYGRFIGGHNLMGFVNHHPVYFSVGDTKEVMSTEEPCDFAYELGNGLLNLPEYPHEFPKPAKHPWPLNDQVVVYVRQLGPGVIVGQAWQEGTALQQVPKKLCSEILMVKRY